MATKKQEEETVKPAEVVAASVDPEPSAVLVSAPADPAPATELVGASGAIAEPEVLAAVDLSHQSVDANPRAGTSAAQNNVDWNDAKRADANDANFEGQGLDLSVYGKGAKT